MQELLEIGVLAARVVDQPLGKAVMHGFVGRRRGEHRGIGDLVLHRRERRQADTGADDLGVDLRLQAGAQDVIETHVVGERAGRRDAERQALQRRQFLLERRVLRHAALGGGLLRDHHVDAAAAEDAADAEELPVLQIQRVEMMRRGGDELDLLRHQRLHVGAVAARDDDLELDAGLLEEVARAPDIDRHVAQAFRRLRDLDLGQALRAHDCGCGDRDGAEVKLPSGRGAVSGDNSLSGVPQSCSDGSVHVIALPLPTDRELGRQRSTCASRRLSTVLNMITTHISTRTPVTAPVVSNCAV